MISVIVPTMGQKQHAWRPLADQDYEGEYEILICREEGVNAARNAGATRAQGDVLVFTDDDCVPPPGWLRKLAAGAGRWDVWGGPVEQHLEEHALHTCPGCLFDLVTRLDYGAVTAVPMVLAANMAMHRSAFERVGPFDERIRIGFADTEWTQRHGGPFGWLPDASTTHVRTSAELDLGEMLRWAHARGRDGAVYRRLRDSWSPVGTGTIHLDHYRQRHCDAALIRLARLCGELEARIA